MLTADRAYVSVFHPSTRRLCGTNVEHVGSRRATRCRDEFFSRVTFGGLGSAAGRHCLHLPHVAVAVEEHEVRVLAVCTAGQGCTALKCSVAWRRDWCGWSRVIECSLPAHARGPQIRTTVLKLPTTHRLHVRENLAVVSAGTRRPRFLCWPITGKYGGKGCVCM